MQSLGEKSGLKRHILIVDDEMVNREILGNLLKNDYEIQILKSKQQKSISTSIPVSNDFFQNNSEEIGEESN